jgi:hypothetical protein
MALAVTAIMVDHELRKKTLVVSAQASGNYTTGGDTVDLTNILNPAKHTDAVIGYPGKIEDWSVENNPAGYSGNLVPGATLKTWKLQVLQGAAGASAPQAEIPQAGYPAALLVAGTTFTLRFVGPKLRM